VNVGNNFGLLACLRTCVSKRYVAASVRGGPASVTRNRPARSGRMRPDGRRGGASGHGDGEQQGEGDREAETASERHERRGHD
jgi:hypothetical protein